MLNREVWVAGLTSLVFVSFALPWILFLAKRYRLYDLPGALKLHHNPVPRLGGLAMTPALLTGVAASGIAVTRSELSLFSAFAMVWIVNLRDDLRGLSPLTRLVVHTAAAALVWESGWRLPVPASPVLSLVSTCLFIAFFVSAFNMLDGSDGMAGGVTAIVALAYVLLKGSLSPLGVIVACSLLGTCTGFLFFNFPPAKLFMGDSGSTILGFTVAFLGLDFYRNFHFSFGSLLIPFLLSAIPLLDATCAVLRRLLARSSPFRGDRRHFYDLLLDQGWSQRRVAVFSYAVSMCLAVLVWIGSWVQFALLAALIAMTIVTFAGIRWGLLRGDA